MSSEVYVEPDDYEPEEVEEVDESFSTTRRTTCASQCIVEGSGLRASTVRQPATFTIVARDQYGDNMEDGGDPMFVSIRGCGLRVRAKVFDQGDGSYLVTYKTEGIRPISPSPAVRGTCPPSLASFSSPCA